MDGCFPLSGRLQLQDTRTSTQSITPSTRGGQSKKEHHDGSWFIHHNSKQYLVGSHHQQQKLSFDL